MTSQVENNKIYRVRGLNVDVKSMLMVAGGGGERGKGRLIEEGLGDEWRQLDLER